MLLLGETQKLSFVVPDWVSSSPVRACPESSRFGCEPSAHQLDHGDSDPRSPIPNTPWYQITQYLYTWPITNVSRAASTAPLRQYNARIDLEVSSIWVSRRWSSRKLPLVTRIIVA